MIENVINNPRIPKAGTIWAWGSNSIPYGWLLCDGSEVSRTTYKALFNSIGTYYGAGNGTTTFNLPNGRISVGNPPVKGNGIALGFTNGTNNYGLINGSSTGLNLYSGSYGGTNGSTGGSSNATGGNMQYGITTDSDKSGLIVDSSNQTIAIIKY